MSVCSLDLDLDFWFACWRISRIWILGISLDWIRWFLWTWIFVLLFLGLGSGFAGFGFVGFYWIWILFVADTKM